MPSILCLHLLNFRTHDPQFSNPELFDLFSMILWLELLPHAVAYKCSKTAMILITD